MKYVLMLILSLGILYLYVVAVNSKVKVSNLSDYEYAKRLIAVEERFVGLLCKIGPPADCNQAKRDLEADKELLNTIQIRGAK